MKRQFFVLFIIFVNIVPLASVSLAQEQPTTEKQPFYYWLNVSGGFVTNHAIGGYIIPTVQKGKNLFSVYIAAIDSLVALIFPERVKHVVGIGFLFGETARGYKNHVSISVGPEYVRQTIIRYNPSLFSSEHTETHKGTLGILVELQYFIKIGKILGIGSQAFISLNTLESHAGISLSLILGKLK